MKYHTIHDTIYNMKLFDKYPDGRELWMAKNTTYLWRRVNPNDYHETNETHQGMTIYKARIQQ